jgi:hypothetical protein
VFNQILKQELKLFGNASRPNGPAVRPLADRWMVLVVSHSCKSLISNSCFVLVGRSGRSDA